MNVSNTIHVVMYSSHTNVCLHIVRLKKPQITCNEIIKKYVCVHIK